MKAKESDMVEQTAEPIPSGVRGWMRRNFSGQDPGAEMTLIEHLEELRGRLFKMLIGFLAGSIAAWFFYDRILALLLSPLRNLPNADRILTGGQLIVTAPQEAFFVRLKVTAFAGLVLAVPLFLWQIWRFVAPGLSRRERRFGVPMLALSLTFIAAGVAFGFAVLPQALRILLGFAGSQMVVLPRATEYLSFLMMLILAFSLTFQIPLLLMFLTLAGVISSAALRRARRFAWIGILILAAAVTPTVDPYTLLLMSVPMVALYEGVILIARVLRR